MKRILFFSPYTPWTPHTMWEVTMAYALRQRGHITHFVTCGGLPDCGMEPARRGHTEATCANCRAVSDILANRLRHKPEFMQSALTETEPGQIAAWAQSLPSEDLRAACYEGLPLGRWTWPDMVGYWHSLEPGLDRPDVEQSYRHLLY